MSYSSLYQEITVIGRGNFGAAYLVENKQTGQRLVAKKILLSGLSDKEVQGSYQEAEILQRLRHPNIVTYHESFCESGQLIILMEYCEVGDLAYHVKQKIKNGQFFTEAEIMNWFVQISMSLQYIHRLGILHRDIKTSNIYLTVNNTVKLGDFGISRVLQGSEAALTVVGTPYYMSPEVCEGKPYSYKSDAWSLGCVLYELCTLKHAFSADNLLGLVFKIVSGTAEPIPSRYSAQLRRITTLMLSKDTNKRMSVQEVMVDPYVLSFMQGFVESDGKNISRGLTIKKSEPVVEVKNPVKVNETPKERIARQKREKADEEFEKMKRASQGAFVDNRVTQQRKHDMLYSTPSTRAFHPAHNRPELIRPSELSNSGSTIASIAFTNRNSIDKNEPDLFNLSVTDMQDFNSQANYESYLKYSGETGNTMNYSDTFEMSGTNYSDDFELTGNDREIKSSGHYDLSTVNEEYSKEDYSDQLELTNVVDLYKNQIENANRCEEPPDSPCVPSDRIINTDKKSAIRKKCVEQMGPSCFNEVYGFLSQARNSDWPDEYIFEQALRKWGKAANSYCLLVDQLLFVERY